MAAVFVLRALIALGAVGTRVLTQAQGPGAGEQTSFGRDVWSFLGNAENRDFQTLYDQSQANGYTLNVADIPGPFELRLAQIHFSRDSGAAGGTDDAIVTQHFVKLAGGAPVAFDDAADLATIEGHITTLWTSVKPAYLATTGLKEVRWYKAGPAIVAPNPPIRITPFAVPGTNGDVVEAPPQVAMSITYLTSDRKGWGRSYMPVGSTDTFLDAHGRFRADVLTTFGNAFRAFHIDLATANLPPVIYSTAKPARTTAAGTELPATGARALGVLSLQIDDVPDVIQSRRWNEPLLRQAETF
jgi:hypothetical protein